jgi:hypothetical protein
MSRVVAGESDVPLLSLEGLVSQDNEEDVVSKNRALSRGDKRRNAKLARLRELVPVGHAVLGIDLADVKQAVVLTDLDSRVLARQRVSAKAWDLGPVLVWARRLAVHHGFCRCDGRMRTDRSPLAGRRTACRPTRYAVCLCESDVGRAGAGNRGLHPRQKR